MTTRTSWRLPLLATAVLIAGTAAGGGTMALWKTAGNPAPAAIIAGDLDVTAGETTWTETSSDVANSGRTIDPETFLVRQGDTVEMTQDFTTRVEGDNMSARIAVDWAEPAELPEGVTADYTVLDSTGTRLGEPTPVGSDLVLDENRLVTGNDGRTDDFSVAVTLDFADMSDRVGAESPLQVADLGRFTFTLDQVREPGARP
ncbi:alternate-type signal peptide domain-containing protein [Brevibacterium casei]|uniref:alternate-type signal peptide domain-containing protein n=1 Tax=Brevibacterium casei TaxID=33889 RepID=UPI0021A64955|nr:alternate-type signal peptide domain-containing protein [Brevibacterium casei]MCT2359963.1 alternate-type signal peptide domain-containing protein [Brevibacterium casei]